MNRRKHLTEKNTCFWFVNAPRDDNPIKQLSASAKLGNKAHPVGRFNDFEKSYNVRMFCECPNIGLAAHGLKLALRKLLLID